MKTTWLSLALLLIGLSSCNNDEQEIKRGAYVPDGYAGLTIQLATGKAADTKAAVGEPLPGGLTDKEKEIKSIAFFVAIPGEAFQSFLSTREPLTPGGLYEPLTETGGPGSGNYTANIRIKGETFGESEVVVIANYAENNLTAALETVKSMEDLKKVTLTITNRAQNPLLMYNYQKLSLKVGETTNGTFAMTRVVARVDIHNKAVNTTTPSNGFVITSACWVNAKTQAYLTAGHTAVEVNALLVNADKSFATYVPNITDASKVDTLYTYENPNDVSATATALEIIGTFRGLNTVKHVDFRRIKTDGTGYETVAIERNKRYVVEITPDKDSTDVKLTINVVDWTLSTDTIKVEETVTKPKLSTITATTLANVTQESNKVYEILDAQAASGTLTFTVNGGNQDTQVDFAYIGRQGASWMNTADAVTSTPLKGYASAELSREYTIDFSKINKAELASAPNKDLPSDVYISIQNVSNSTIAASDTILIKFRPLYNGLAGLKPVLMKDGKFWAPVNVGATQIPTSVPITGDVSASCGNLFQWGRKLALPGVSAATPALATVNPTQSDLEGMEENASWKDKFIPSKSSGPNTQSNWLLLNSSGDNPAGGSMVADAWYQRLWDSNQVAGNESNKPQKTLADPCPAGWRVPSIADWKAIGAGNTSVVKVWDTSAHIMKIAGAIGSENLVLPAAGSRLYRSGASGSQGSSGYYWSSSVPSGTVNASNVNFYSEVLITYTDYRANGLSVRCVQE